MGTSSERTHPGQRARARSSSSHALCFGLCSGSATPRESMTGPLELCRANPAHSLWNCLGQGSFTSNETHLAEPKEKRICNCYREPHTSQERKIELQTTWSVEAEATAQPQGHHSLHVPWGPGPCDCAAERGLLCSPLWGCVVCGFLFHISASFSLSRPASLSVIPWTLGPVEAVGMETSGPEPRAFQWVSLLLCPPVSDTNSQRKESDGPKLDSFLLIPISKRSGVEMGASGGLPPQYCRDSNGCPSHLRRSCTLSDSSQSKF